MNNLSKACIGAAALLFAVASVAQRSGAAFTATGKNCSDITWSTDVLAKFPNIGSACESVLEKDGEYYVKFSGTVQRVSTTGRYVTIGFSNGDSTTLRPEGDQKIYIAGKSYRVSDLTRGQKLHFYVPASRFVAQFYEPAEPTVTATPMVAAIETPAAQPMDNSMDSSALPKTASPLPMLGFAGLLALALGGMLTAIRVSARRR
jgi:hypothetical protein